MANLWNWLNGAKTFIGLAVLVVWTGLVDLELVSATGDLANVVTWAYTVLIGVGVGHKATKALGVTK